MSKIALSGNASGTGTLTIAAPNTSTDRTLTLPNATGTVQVSGNPISGTTGTFSGAISGTTGTFSGDLTLGSSTLATPTGSAPSYLCRAWVNFNGTGTVAIRESGNVSSITDNGTGDYTVNFTNAMADANYSAVFSYSRETNAGWYVDMQWDQATARTTTAVRMKNQGSDSTWQAAVDKSIVDVVVFR